MKKRILYIYGYGSNENSGTRENLQKLLGEDYEVMSVNYEQKQPNEAIEYLSNIVEEYRCEAVIGSSLGGFYALQLPNKVKKIVINPCMRPSIELEKIGCPSFITPRFIEFEKFSKDDNVLGLFGNSDELLGEKNRMKFKNEVNTRIHMFPAKHRPTLSDLLLVKATIEEFINK